MNLCAIKNTIKSPLFTIKHNAFAVLHFQYLEYVECGTLSYSPLTRWSIISNVLIQKAIYTFLKFYLSFLRKYCRLLQEKLASRHFKLK